MLHNLYYHEMMNIYSEEKKTLEKDINKRKDEINKIRFLSESADIQEQMVRKYIEKINVDCFLKTVEPNFTSEYERIKQYVF